MKPAKDVVDRLTEIVKTVLNENTITETETGGIVSNGNGIECEMRVSVFYPDNIEQLLADAILKPFQVCGNCSTFHNAYIEGCICFDNIYRDSIDIPDNMAACENFEKEQGE